MQPGNPAPPWPQEAPLTACARTSRNGTCHWLPMAWPGPMLLLLGLSAAMPSCDLPWDVWHLPGSRWVSRAGTPAGQRQSLHKGPATRQGPPTGRGHGSRRCGAAPPVVAHVQDGPVWRHPGWREWWALLGSLQTASARAEAVAPGLAANQKAPARRPARRWANWGSLQSASARAAACNQQAPRRRRVLTRGRQSRHGVGALPARVQKGAAHPHRASHDWPPAVVKRHAPSRCVPLGCAAAARQQASGLGDAGERRQDRHSEAWKMPLGSLLSASTRAEAIRVVHGNNLCNACIIHA